MALLTLEEEIYNYYCGEMADTLWSIGHWPTAAPCTVAVCPVEAFSPTH